MGTPAITDLQVKNILVLTDFSACSRKALLYGVNIARRHTSKLALLHILPPQRGLPQHHRDEALSAASDQMKRLDNDLQSKGVLHDIQHQLLVRRGKSWAVISSILKMQSTDLIVVGTHGRTGFRKLILGSFAEDVFRHAACPVLTVGPRITDRAITEPPRQILFPTDGSYASKAAEPYAFQLGRAPGAQLTLLGVIHVGLLKDSEVSNDERLEHARAGLRATGLYAAWREGGTAPNVVAEIGPEVKTVLDVADRTETDLIVLGISPKGDSPEIFAWADAYQVVCSARCPVLTVRNTFPDPYFKRLLNMEPVGIHGKATTGNAGGQHQQR